MLRQLIPLILLAAVGSAQAGQLAGSGDRLQMLRKIQGQWQSDCQQASAGVASERTTLRFSFTHLYQRVTKYADRQCQRRVVDGENSFAFRLGDPVITAGGDRAYAIDFRVGDGESASPRLHPANLVHYRDGQLRLGLVGAEQSNQRLMQLDHRLTFTRP